MRELCAVCPRPVNSGRWCAGHGSRVRRHGDPLTDIPLGKLRASDERLTAKQQSGAKPAPALRYENRRSVVVTTRCGKVEAATEFTTPRDLTDVDYLVAAAAMVEEALWGEPASAHWSFGVASVSLASNDRPYP